MDAHVVTAETPEFSRLVVKFYYAPLYNERRSKGYIEERVDLDTGEIKRIWHKGEGREIWEDKEFIEIRIPGNVSEIRCREVRETDKLKWPREYEAFKKGHEAPVRGTPTDKLPFLTLSQVQELKAFGIKTAEDLLTVSDSDAQKFMGINALKQKAKDYLEALNGGVPLEQARSEIAALKAQVAELAKIDRKGR